MDALMKEENKLFTKKATKMKSMTMARLTTLLLLKSASARNPSKKTRAKEGETFTSLSNSQQTYRA